MTSQKLGSVAVYASESGTSVPLADRPSIYLSDRCNLFNFLMFTCLECVRSNLFVFVWETSFDLKRVTVLVTDVQTGLILRSWKMVVFLSIYLRIFAWLELILFIDVLHLLGFLPVKYTRVFSKIHFCFRPRTLKR